MANDAFLLFNTKSLFHTTASSRRGYGPDPRTRRHLARLLAIASANDAPDATLDGEPPLQLDAQTQASFDEPAARAAG